MIAELKERCTRALSDFILEQVDIKANTIFVLAGITPYIDVDTFEDRITDRATFDKEGNADVFNNEWLFTLMIPKLATANCPQIISHQQFAYICEYLNEEYLRERIVLVNDNLRTQYPLAKEDYLEGDQANEERPDNLPIYQAEQYKIGERYYYSLKEFSSTFDKKSFFEQVKELEIAPGQEVYDVLDVTSDPYAIDSFVNQCIEDGNFSKKVCVKISHKDVQNTTIRNILKVLNSLLSSFEGGVYLLEEETIEQEYTPREETLALLRQYWGDNARFRNISVYRAPEVDNTIIPVSQGLIVETIINEYMNGCNGGVPRDIFITAPTGAGKSLIFQLPAFHVANQGDVTIVVSPLKALMADQVENLRTQRGYNKVGFLNSDLTLRDRDTIISGCQTGDIDILYLSPELLLSYDIHYFLGERKLGLLIVDEAHLITTWGRNFRVDYWFLGNYINKIRKFNNYKFPMVALTATAVYGGANDMVFDSISSLNMHNPHKFIGSVRRNNIEFVLTTHGAYTEGKYDEDKENETVGFISGIHELGMKGIVYAPYTRHIDRLKDRIDERDRNMVVAYHGDMKSDQQQYSYQSFRNNDHRIMISTKAFGMGVDIPDIQIVYHHAPSGLLPDYIQEIGRAARNENIQGFAALTFAESDLRYSRQLFGMSLIRSHQLREVLRKIILCFKNNGRKRNMLVATNDFAHIFDTEKDVDKKVVTALMMIEKDYLIKTRFNVLIARPRKVFTRVYARISDTGIGQLRELYGNCFAVIQRTSNPSYVIIELNLDQIWSDHFSDRSFPQLRGDFYRQRFLRDQGISLTPVIKVAISFARSNENPLAEVTRVKEAISNTFASFIRQRKFFRKDDFILELSERLNPVDNVSKIADFILSTYSSTDEQDTDAFLQQRGQGTEGMYQVLNTNYEAKLARLLRILSHALKQLGGNNTNRGRTAVHYLTINEEPLRDYIRLGSLLEVMDLGVFETTGGKDPKIFLRLNDPKRIEKDSESANYQNTILDSVRERHEESCDIFTHFFMNQFSNEQRWNMIEDFFLGMSNEELKERYPGTGANPNVNIIDYLRENATIAEEITRCNDNDGSGHVDLFQPRENESYTRNDLLTIEGQTNPIHRWITVDPVLLHRTMMEYNITIDRQSFQLLSDRLRHRHFEYYRDYMGLRLLIDFPGYVRMVEARVPYQDDPVEFYRWWRRNEGCVTLTFQERIRLFQAVMAQRPNALLDIHRNQLQ